MSNSTDKSLRTIKGVSRVAGLRSNGTLTEGVSEDPSKKLDQPATNGAKVVDQLDAVTAANKAAQDATQHAPLNQPHKQNGEEGKIPYDATVASVAAGAEEVPQLANNKAPALPAMPQQTLESAPKTKGGLINAIYEHLLTLDVKDLADVFSKGVAPLAHREPKVGLIGSEPQKNIADAKPTAPKQFGNAEGANASADSKLSGKSAASTTGPTSDPPSDKLSPPSEKSAEKATDEVKEPDAPRAKEELPPEEDEEEKARKQSLKVAEALNTLISAEKNLSEGFKNGAAAIVESCIRERVATHVARIEENYGVQLAEETAKIETALAEKVDSYLNYVVQNWMEENKVAIERGLRTEIAEGFIEGLKSLFKENYIEVPEGKENLVEELNSEVSKLEAQLLKQTQNNMKLSESVTALQRKSILESASKGLAATEAAKLTTLTAEVDFDDAATFTKKVGLIKESFFHRTPTKTETKPAAGVLTESGTQVTIDAGTGEEASIEELSSSMALYSAAVTRTAKADADRK